MNPIKIIFFDVDGTLIDMQRKQISENTLIMLRRLQQNGIIICLATGRLPVCLPKIEGIAFDAYLTSNGSFCFSGEKIIYINPIPAQDLRRIIQNAASIGRPVSVANRECIVANGWDQDLADYYSIAHLTLEVSDNFENVASQEVLQIMMGCRPKDYPAILKDVTGARITSAWDRAVDIIPAGGGKGRGVEKILEFYHLDKSQAMAFGDGINDIEMLQSVGTGVAMENASPQLKAVAKDFCGHVAEDGIYHYCIQHGLI